MYIRSIQIKNFRNYQNVDLVFSRYLNFFVGKNATGKTNLLEALGYFVLYRSFRGVSDFHLIRHQENFFYLKIETEKETGKKKDIYEAGIEKTTHTLRKKIKKNNKKVPKISDLFRDIIGVFFTPDDLSLIESSSKRRNFFDQLFSTVDHEYFDVLMDYQKCLRQRNELLKRIFEKKAKVEELDFWDQKMIQLSKRIMEKRKKYLDEYQDFFLNRIKEISRNKDVVHVRIMQNDLKDFEKLFKENRYKDIYAGTTTMGIHRDKFVFIDSHQQDINLSFSQGQKRTIALSLKLAQYDIFLEKFQLKPILFIDDVIRELDQYRRKYFLNILLSCGQAFFTTPDFDTDMQIFRNIKKDCKIFKIEEGKVLDEY